MPFLARTPLYDHAVATFNGFVYAIAGSVEGKASLLLQDRVQCYNPRLNHWDFVGAMQEARAKAAAAEHEGLLYVSGKASRVKIPLLFSANRLREKLRSDATFYPTILMDKIRPHHLLFCPDFLSLSL